MPDTPDPQQNQTPGQVLAGSPPPPQQQPPPPPDASNMPLNSRPSLVLSGQVQQPTPQQLQKAAVDEHHKNLGKVVHFLFGDEIDPQTGKKIPERPGTIFRSLLAGALLGGAAGLKEGHGWIGGVTAGGSAGMAAREQRDQQNQEQFQQRQKMTQDEQAAADQHLLHQANVAHLVAETASFHHLQEFHDQEAMDKKNAASRAYMKSLEDAGAHPAQIAINGKIPTNGEYTAPAIAAALTRDPSLLHAAPGSIRHFVDLQNAGDLNYVEGKGWVDDSGTPVDMSKSTVVKAYDVPENVFKTPVHKTGKQINDLAGYQIIPQDQEDRDFTLPFDGVTGLYQQNLKNLNAAAQADQRNAAAAKAKAQAKNAAVKRGTPAQFAAVEAKKAAAIAKAETAYQKSDKPEAQALDDLNRAKAAAQKSYEDQIKDLGGSVTSTAVGKPTANANPAPTPRKGETQIHAGFTYTFDGTQWVKGQPAQ